MAGGEPNRLTGCLQGPCGNENMVSKPVIFLGGTVLSFNASLGIGPTQESTLSVDIINDCQTSGYQGWTSYNDPQGDFFYGYPKIGAPVFFSVCEAMRGDVDCEESCFEFGGILTNFTATQSSSGRTFNAKVVDPRSILDSSILIVNNYIEGPIKHRNYFNIYAFYEKNILPSGSLEPEPIGLLIPNSPGFPSLDTPITPSGDADGSDCSVFGTANVADGGMSYLNILAALKNIKPLIYVGNYNQEYAPLLGGRDLAVSTQQQPNPGVPKLYHENNVLQLDMTGFPEIDVPPYFRIPGPALSILELLTAVCDAMGMEFIVSLEKNLFFPAAPHTIKITTKKIDDNDANATIRDNILYYDGKSTEFSYGKELRLDKNRTVLVGDQEHFIFESSIVDFYFGEDKEGNPIVQLNDNEIATNFVEYSGCGFVVPIEIDELNSLLECPLYDDKTNDIVDRKVLITEEDIRAALSSEQLWKTRTFSSGIVGDFNHLIRYNFPDETNQLVRENLQKLTRVSDTNTSIDNNEFVPENSARAFADAMQSANDRYSVSNKHSKTAELAKVHQYVQNIGKTYYGRQYLVSLKSDDDSVLNVCVLPADTYDDFYFTGSNYESTQISECGEELVIPANTIYRETIYSHIPTNAGGWVDPCVKVLGINNNGYTYDGKIFSEASLSFVRDSDDRVGPFARFDTKELYISHKAKFIDPEGSTADREDEKVLQDFMQANNSASFIANACGEVDISLFNVDDYLLVRTSGGICTNPVSSQIRQDEWDGPAITGVLQQEDAPIIVWVKGQIEEKIYIIQASGSDCCPGCHPTSGCNIPKVVFKFANPVLKRLCNDKADFSDTLIFTAQALSITSEIMADTGVITTPGLESIKPSKSICGIPTTSGLSVLEQMQVASDSASSNSYGYYAAADRPSRVAIPLKSNITTYGPWYSSNFNTSAGGVNFNQDSDLVPWNYGSLSLMNVVGQDLAKSAESNVIEFETGSVTYPYWPELKLGFLDNGPNLTNISVVYGSNGVSTNYTWQTYTPKFGNLKNLENQHLKDSYTNKLKAQKQIRQEKLADNITRSKLNPDAQLKINEIPKITKQYSQDRVLVGEMYDFGIIRNDLGVVKSNSQRVVVGSETLNKMVLDLRYDYNKKAFMSFDGIFSPVSVSGGGIAGKADDYVLPRFAAYSPKDSGNAKSVSLAPVPPFKINTTKQVLNLDISRNYINPLTNMFGSGEHYHDGSGVGHCIDIVGRDEYATSDSAKLSPYIPGKGIMNSFYGQTEWDRRYSKDYRFLGLRGPLVLHSWGYDTQGKPIPNAVDDYDKIMGSGHFEPSGLKDEFYEDWLQKPATWPVAPVDLRFDRERGVWVSPPQHKIVVAKASTNIEPYGVGSGILIDDKYGYEVYDANGTLINTGESGNAIIEIEDRIGSAWSKDQKAYAYYDTFTSKYLLLAGGGSASIRLGKYSGSWPKEMGKNIKQVTLYKMNNNDPTDWIPDLNSNGDVIVASAINFISYVPVKPNSDRNPWCYIFPFVAESGTYNRTEFVIYGNVQTEVNYDQLWLLLSAEC